MAVKRRVGYLPEIPPVYLDMTVREYLGFVARLRGLPRKALKAEVERVAERAGVDHILPRLIGNVSKGYRQRVGIAQALIGSPAVLILDEPTVGLDPVAAREVIAMLRDAMKSRTALLCTHNLAEAEALCDAVVVLRDGRVVLDDTIDAMKKRAPAHVSLGAAQGPQAIVDTLAAIGLEAAVQDDRAVMLTAEPEQTLPGVLRALVANNLDVFECVASPPTLEELFLRAVKDEPRP